MRCPRCDGQGAVHAVRLKRTGERCRLCDECDALWPDGVPVRTDTHRDFATYVRPLGLRGLWSEIDDLGPAAPG